MQKQRTCPAWAPTIAVIIGLLVSRMPVLACQCGLTPCSQLPIPTSAGPLTNSGPDGCCCTPSHSQEQSAGHSDCPTPSDDSPEKPVKCDCNCPLCKPAQPARSDGASEGTLESPPAGDALEHPRTPAPDVERLVLLRPPRH